PPAARCRGGRGASAASRSRAHRIRVHSVAEHPARPTGVHLLLPDRRLLLDPVDQLSRPPPAPPPPRRARRGGGRAAPAPPPAGPPGRDAADAVLSRGRLEAVALH